MTTTTCGCGHDFAAHRHNGNTCTAEGCGCGWFIENKEEWLEAKARWDYEDAETDKMWDEVYRQEEQERKDNEPPSGWTDLGNPGGTKFCY